MLNSTKTWQEDYHKQELIRKYTDVFLDNKDKIDVLFVHSCLSNLVSDLRKKDEEELIKMIKEKEQDLTNLTENNDIWKSLGDDARLHNLVLGMCERLIKEYYQNN